MLQTWEFLIFAMLVSATPLLLAAIGELVAESSGVMNLGVEGMMAVGAATGFATAFATQDYWLALFVGALAGTMASAVFAILVIFLRADQVASGIAIGLLLLGVSAMIGRDYEGLSVPIMERLTLPVLSGIPVLGKGAFSQNPIVYLTGIGAIATWWVLRRSRLGLVIRAVGENPHAAEVIGYRVWLVRFLATLFGGFMAGLGGAFLSVASTPLWVDGLVGGRGWIVISLIVFGTWRMGRIAFGALLFGFIENLDFLLQARGAVSPSQVLTCLPYAAAIVAITIVSTNTRLTRLFAPRSLGQNYND